MKMQTVPQSIIIASVILSVTKLGEHVPKTADVLCTFTGKI